VRISRPSSLLSGDLMKPPVTSVPTGIP
jgi:hypothetical protein